MPVLITLATKCFSLPGAGGFLLHIIMRVSCVCLPVQGDELLVNNMQDVEYRGRLCTYTGQQYISKCCSKMAFPDFLLAAIVSCTWVHISCSIHINCSPDVPGVMEYHFINCRWWVQTPVRLNLGCVALLSKSYLNHKYQLPVHQSESPCINHHTPVRKCDSAFHF